MEHEVFVPVPVPALRRTLDDPVRVARCVPGFQQDADASAGPLTGRLRIRAGGHTITYRGTLSLTPLPGDPDVDSVHTVRVEGEGTEARGDGSARLSMTVRLTEGAEGTSIAFDSEVTGDGRLRDLEPAAALAAAHRLLDRFAQQLVTESLAARSDDGTDGPADGSADGAAAGAAAVTAEEAAVGEAVEEALEEAAEEAPERDSLYDAPIPPSSLDPVAGIEFTVADEPPAEAAHARRTMIGRSAEEVDHAPPRGRYAPVPSPDSVGAGATLRWVAPAAVLALASAVVVSRALRRRR
ncbi:MULTISPECIES: SRPBCC domain-containing protein [unclassified Streptomyces]|uniref:SRPBCC domain-containing protein n=1 Tax=unclassified Streptomyces TaxID=2593676 RepID=UPI0018F4A754|nr:MULTISPECIES: SRPBCC domain-containing protein [unclassified Streptomyces]